jgi:hypothetical protein
VAALMSRPRARKHCLEANPGPRASRAAFCILKSLLSNPLGDAWNIGSDGRVTLSPDLEATESGASGYRRSRRVGSGRDQGAVIRQCDASQKQAITNGSLIGTQCADKRRNDAALRNVP